MGERIELVGLLSDFAAETLEAIHPTLIVAIEDIMSNEMLQYRIEEVVSTVADGSYRGKVFPSLFIQIEGSAPVLIEANPTVIKTVSKLSRLILASGGKRKGRSPFALLQKALVIYGKLPAALRDFSVKAGIRVMMLRYKMRYTSLEEIERLGLFGIKIHPKALTWLLTGTQGLYRTISNCRMLEISCGTGWGNGRLDQFFYYMKDLMPPLFPITSMVMHDHFHPEDKTKVKILSEDFKEKAPLILETMLRKHGYFNQLEQNITTAA